MSENEEKYNQENMVLEGKDGYLFLKGGNHQVLNLFTQKTKPSLISINNFWENLISRKGKCELLSIEYKHFVFPDKIYLLRNKLNENITSVYKQYYEPLKINQLCEYLDFNDTDCEDYFSKTDTHLNAIGNIRILEHMFGKQLILNDLISRIEQDLYVEDLWIGDLGSKVNLAKPESISKLKTQSSVKRVHNGVKGGNNGIIDIFCNEKSVKDEKLLIFGDSFFRSLLPYLTFLFKEIVFCRTPFYHDEVVSLYKPNIVFTGNAERYLSNVKNDIEATNFFEIPIKEKKVIEVSTQFEKCFEKVFNKNYQYLLKGTNV